MMRDVHVEKFLLLPFSIGCDSKSSVAIAASTLVAAQLPGHKNSKLPVQKGEEKKQSRVGAKEKPGSSVYKGLHRFIKRFFTRLSQLFAHEEGVDHVEEKEMEIGLPTDVKHVTHIGLDGLSRINSSFSRSIKLNSDDIDQEIPSISLEQFELAMAAQSRRP